MLVNRNFFINLMFNLVMKRKMKRLLATSVDNLEQYCSKTNSNDAATTQAIPVI
jgi:hypothetical protein